MLTKEQRAAVFWAVCIPLRLHAALRPGPVTRVAALVIGARWLAGLEVGDEGVFGGPAWWAEDRPTHGALWFAHALTGDRRYLLMDVGYGVQNWFSNVYA